MLRSVFHWFNLRLKQSFALLIFAVVIDMKQICSVGRSRSLSKKKPKVNFVDASSCESGMEISAALSRLSISLASQRNESTNNVLFSFPNVPRASTPQLKKPGYELELRQMRERSRRPTRAK